MLPLGETTCLVSIQSGRCWTNECPTDGSTAANLRSKTPSASWGSWVIGGWSYIYKQNCFPFCSCAKASRSGQMPFARGGSPSLLLVGVGRCSVSLICFCPHVKFFTFSSVFQVCLLFEKAWMFRIFRTLFWCQDWQSESLFWVGWSFLLRLSKIYLFCCLFLFGNFLSVEIWFTLLKVLCEKANLFNSGWPFLDSVGVGLVIQKYIFIYFSLFFFVVCLNVSLLCSTMRFFHLLFKILF